MNEKFKVVNNYDYLTKDFIAEGQNGICYKYNDQVFKKFKNKPMFLFFLKALSNINSNSLILPQEFIYLNEYNSKNILGYLMKYVDGSKLNNLPDLITRLNKNQKFNHFPCTYQIGLKDNMYLHFKQYKLYFSSRWERPRECG